MGGNSIQPFFKWRNFAKREIKIKTSKISDLEVFNCRSKGKTNDDRQISIFGFQCATKNIEG
jgi:hypothetical protein